MSYNHWAKPLYLYSSSLVYKKFIINTKINIKGSKALMINAYTLYETQNGKALVSIRIKDTTTPVLE